MEQAVAAIDLLEGLAGNTEPAKCCQLLERLFGIVHPVLDRDVMRRFDTKAAAVQEHSSRLEALRVFQIGRDGLDILDDLKRGCIDPFVSQLLERSLHLVMVQELVCDDTNSRITAAIPSSATGANQ